MPFNPTIRDALSVAGNKPAPSVRDAIEGEHVWTPASGQNVQDLVPNLIRTIAYNGKLFVRDDADTTTAHDGVACIVTQGGVRFKATDYGAGALIRRFAVLSIIPTPPASPAVGDVHIVGIGATGVWAAKDGKVAHRTSAGWVYITPKLYDEAHVAAVLQIYHYNASSLWVAGIPALTLAVAQVHFSNLRHGLGQAVENQTTNTPPPSPSDGVAYIIGPSPTGAWSGHALKFTEWRNSAWEIYTPQIGWTVYNKGIDVDVQYTATGWTQKLTGYSKVASSTVFSGGSIAATYALSSTAPTTSNTDVIASLVYAAKKAGSKIEINVQVDLASVVFATGTIGVGTVPSIGVFYDGAAAAFAWSGGPRIAANQTSSHTITVGMCLNFEHVSVDNSNHTYTARASFTSGVTGSVSLQKIRMTIREQA